MRHKTRRRLGESTTHISVEPIRHLEAVCLVVVRHPAVFQERNILDVDRERAPEYVGDTIGIFTT